MIDKTITTGRALRMVLACAAALLSVAPLPLAAADPRPVAPRGPLSDEETRAVEIFARSAPSVVFIFAPVGGRAADPVATEARAIAGTGVVWDEAGHIVTNSHVIGRVRQITVRFGDGEMIRARLLATAQDFDLAVLKLESAPAGLRPITIGESAPLRVGQRVYAIGHPLALGPSLSSGVISGVDRRLPVARGREIEGVIQTDAAINPGNSGGPLLDSAGRMVGLNTAILSRTGGSEGLGFAIPVDTLNRIVPQLISSGRIVRPGIGVHVADAEFARRQGVNGIVIMEVERGTPAQAAGLRGFDQLRNRPRDVITRIGDVPVEGVSEFAREIERAGIGREVELTVRRGASERRVRVRVADIALPP
jgi:2-alkenal reductase